MSMHIRTSHRIVSHGPNKMVLSDCATGAAVVTALREGDGVWRVAMDDPNVDDRITNHGEGRCAVPDHHRCGTHESTRCAVVNTMIKMADEFLPVSGLSIFVPHRLDENGELVHLRDEL